MPGEHDPNGLPEGFSAHRIKNHLAESRRYFEDLKRHWGALVAAHEGEWVASYGGEFRFGASIEDAIASARQAGWPLDVIAVERLTRERAAVLLTLAAW